MIESAWIFFAGIALGAALALALTRRQPRAVRAEPLPCVLFPKEMLPAERVAWLRWLIAGLQAKQAEEEGGDDAR